MDFLRKNKIGLVLRPFAASPNNVIKTVDDTMDTIVRAKSLTVKGLNVFSRIDIVVTMDKRFPDHDCGETARVLKNIGADRLGDVHVHEVPVGDLFGGVIRHAFFRQIFGGIDYTMLLSTGVRSYITGENMRLMLEALEKGARVTGLAIDEFADSIMEGRLLDTCDLWHLESWMLAGGHSVRGDQPMLTDRIGWVNGGEGSDGIDGSFHYVSAGVEEMFPLVNMVKLFGPCIAPIRPTSVGEWKIPDDPQVRAREERKFRTKLERQIRAAFLEGVNLDFLKNGIMPEYR